MSKGREPDLESHVFISMGRPSDAALLSLNSTAKEDQSKGSEIATARQALQIRPRDKGGDEGVI